MTYTSYPQSHADWRGRFIFEIAHALADLNDIELKLWGPYGPIPRNSMYLTTDKEKKWLKTMSDQGGIAHLLTTNKLAFTKTSIKLLTGLSKVYRSSKSIDILHINWLQNALPLRGTHTPALITVLGTDYKLLEKNPLMVKAIRRVLKQRRCIIAPNADWMSRKLYSYFGDVAKILPINFGVHSDFLTINRKPDYNKRKWLVVLRITKKKIGPLFDWGQEIFNKNHQLHLIGPMQEQISIPDWVNYHGATNPHNLAKEYFPDALGLITLSHHDEGLPQILIDAMASGLPVITSSINAHTDIVQQMDTGIIVDSKSAFIEAITLLSEPSTNKIFGDRARLYIQNNYGQWAECASRYRSAYIELLS